MSLKKVETKKYLSILSDGHIHMTVDESHPDAKKREYETSTGEKGVKYEVLYQELDGTILGLEFQDGNFGKMLQVSIRDDENEDFILSIGTESNYGEDLMKKLPNVKLLEKIVFSPYAFTDDKGKTRKGITLYQDGNKIPNFFWDAEKKKSLHGYPKVEGDTKKFQKDDWKIFYMQARKFLINYTEENVCDKLSFNDSLDEMGAE